MIINICYYLLPTLCITQILQKQKQSNIFFNNLHACYSMCLFPSLILISKLNKEKNNEKAYKMFSNFSY